mmetsp:Transcript_22267/g.25776  ORF Transcript_22267/g.25776 Transcript_22267/m.25776 type:complete len:433 (-) Transcript_22267:40-1338(-)
MMSLSLFEEIFCNGGIAAPLSASASASALKPTMTTTAVMEFHVAVYRKPIFLYGYYTKTRRDVSQSPFFVMREKRTSATTTMIVGTTKEKINDENDDGVSSSTITTKKQMERLGVTSVEEQICGPIQDLLGISTRNNIIVHTNYNHNNNNTTSGVLYGMIKFHASGREDMDVRMVVKKQQKQQQLSVAADSSKSRVYGRPFCVQIVDALRPIVSKTQLRELIDTINCNNNNTTTTTTNNDKIDSIINHNFCGDGNNKAVISYGQNPWGVGISSSFKPVPAALFSGLQKDTESKMKHYGCYCWSKNKLPQSSLSSSSTHPPSATIEQDNDDNGNTDDLTSFIFKDISFPFTIQQKTPIRVLHRRSNLIRERQIIFANARRLDDHHFRLELTTQAGTYVKEFVYGDLGRTIPSVSSLMGCKTNLLQLDCEGIEM